MCFLGNSPNDIMPSKNVFKLAEEGAEGYQADVAGGQHDARNLLDPPQESRIRLKWEDRLAQLQAFRTRHGHLDVPRMYRKDPSLGTFVCN